MRIFERAVLAMENSDLELDFAGESDIPTVLGFIKELADYEHMSSEVVATEEKLRDWMFDKGVARALIARVDGEPVGFALFFHNFSTFLGRAGIYLEDLYVHPTSRGRGVGRALLKKLSSLAVGEGCGWLEWSCLDWNLPSIGFYKSLGAKPMDDWTVYRLEGRMLSALSEG